MSDWFDTVNWAELQAAYGTAEAIPHELKRLPSLSKAEAIESIFYLRTTVFHQFSIYSVTPYVLKFCLELIPVKTIPVRARLLEFFGDMASNLDC